MMARYAAHPMRRDGVSMFRGSGADGMDLTDEPAPLDVLLAAMHAHWRNGDLDKAARLARVAAPYLHARQRSGPSVSERTSASETMTDAQLERMLESGSTGDGDQAKAPRIA